MFQITIFHIDDEHASFTLADLISEVESHGLEVVSKVFRSEWDEWAVTLRGSKEQFLAWDRDVMEGSPGYDPEEMLAELLPVAV